MDETVRSLDASEIQRALKAAQILQKCINEAVVLSRSNYAGKSNYVEFNDLAEFQQRVDARAEQLDRRVAIARNHILRAAPSLVPDRWLSFELYPPMLTYVYEGDRVWILGTEDAEHYDDVDDSDVVAWEEILVELDVLRQRLIAAMERANTIAPKTPNQKTKSKPRRHWEFHQQWLKERGFKTHEELSTAEVQAMVSDYRESHPDEKNFNKRNFQKARADARKHGWGTNSN